MIDLDLLDEQLEQALSDEVRLLRGGSPQRVARTDWSAPRSIVRPPAAPEGPAYEADEDPWDLDWSDEERPPDGDDIDGEEPESPAPPAEEDVEEDVAAPVEPVGPPAEPPVEPVAAVKPAAKVATPAPTPSREAATAARPRPRPRRQQPVPRQPIRPFRTPIGPLEEHFEYELKDRPSADRPQPKAARAERAERRARTTAAPRPSALERLREAAAALSGPDGAPRDLAVAEHARAIPELIARGELRAADQHLATHAALSAERGSTHDRVDAATWETMRALLDGRRDDALDGLDAVRRLGGRAADPRAADRAATLRFRVGLEWGDEGEQFELLDACRERAYRFNQLPWRAALTLQLARLGRADEATREFDAVAGQLRHGLALDVLCDLAEAAFLLGDGHRARLVENDVRAATVSLVTVGPAWVCKGSVARFAAHVAAARRRWEDADRCFAAALKAHRRIGAEPLMARTLHEWGTTLLGRDDDLARRHLDEAAELAARLRLNLSAAVPA